MVSPRSAAGRASTGSTGHRKQETRKANKTNQDGKLWLLNRAGKSMSNTQVIQKEQLEKNRSELILSIKGWEGYHFKRLIAIDVPILLLSFPIKTFTRIRSNIKAERLRRVRDFSLSEFRDSFLAFD